MKSCRKFLSFDPNCQRKDEFEFHPEPMKLLTIDKSLIVIKKPNRIKEDNLKEKERTRKIKKRVIPVF
jgi:hypothetical protein